ncbi:DUF2231 domain-containing protein [Lipingzhangella sp. LS1_29]|uniref:DUF2231 domain-containing protein n=1 Tax=Lipingzhangella rawalii TaxID=2055835 RepID=A0ABU2H3N6_9ACTN|nr:DUF2231 domain-containing protein [Lipingzhangella rawalii]MDS1269920.1 DUF2231 domain-containing protein [Lipingzhangella rawalii]
MHTHLLPLIPTVDGLPLHPLVIHATIVLVPLAVLAALPIAVRSHWRRRFGWPVAILAVLSWVTVPVAVWSGQDLAADMYGSELTGVLADHERLGTQLPLIVGLFTLATVLVVVLGSVGDRRWTSTSPGDVVPRWWWFLVTGLAIVSLAAGGWAVGQLVIVGHTGSEAVWGHVLGN